jgi:hypothetical protein
MEVILELSPETTQLYQKHDDTNPQINELTSTIDALNVILKPQYRGEDDTESDYFFVIETTDIDECNRIAQTLNRLPAVKAAYCKPEAEPAFLP